MHYREEFCVDVDYMKSYMYSDLRKDKSPSLWDCLQSYKTYHSQLRLRLGMCVFLYVVGILSVLVAYYILWLREHHRTNLDCII